MSPSSYAFGCSVCALRHGRPITSGGLEAPGRRAVGPQQRIPDPAAWIDERRKHSISVARGVGRPVWLGAHDEAVFFASTKVALEVVERFLGLELRMGELDEGTLVQLELGRETSRKRFNPDRRFEDEPLPPVRAPKEAARCLRRLATIVAAG